MTFTLLYGANWVTHYFLDVIPYYIHGNGPVKPTECQCESIK